jgi:hypothetical protein
MKTNDFKTSVLCNLNAQNEFSGLSRTKQIFQDIPKPGKLMKKLKAIRGGFGTLYSA